MNEQSYENELHIETVGNQLRFYDTLNYHRYEPTPYACLEKLIQHYEFTRFHHVVDFGCGKGRLNVFLAHYTNASVTGVELNEDFYQKATKNFRQYQKKHGKPKSTIDFFLGLAEDYPISEKNNVFYFFNPFSIHVFRNIMHRILQSAEVSPRSVTIILYYPSPDYTEFLEQLEVFQLKKEIVCADTDPYERFLVYKLMY